MNQLFNIYQHGLFHVLRDDIVMGGTKRRVLNHIVDRSPHSDFYYAGTVMGHGALALAHACGDHGKRAHIYLCGTDDDAIVKLIRTTNAELILKPPMPITALYEEMTDGAQGHIFPPGFDTPDFSGAMVEVLKEFDATPYSEIWVCAVSGTLSRAIKRAFRGKTVKTVSVVKSTDGDYHAPEKYHQAAKSPPPYPSCPYTDSKIWQFAQTHAAPDALIWNTAG